MQSIVQSLRDTTEWLFEKEEEEEEIEEKTPLPARPLFNGDATTAANRRSIFVILFAVITIFLSPRFPQNSEGEGGRNHK